MSAYKNNKNGHKIWLIENSYGGWLYQYRPDQSDVDLVAGQFLPDFDEDTHVYSIKVKEFERKELFKVKAGAGEPR